MNAYTTNNLLVEQQDRARGVRLTVDYWGIQI